MREKFALLLFNYYCEARTVCLQKKKRVPLKKMPSTFSLSPSAFFHTTALSLKNDRGGGGGKGETRRKRENLSKSNETVVVVATRTNFDERKSRRREALLVSFPSLTSAFVVFFSLLLNDADSSVEEWSEED